jgi:ankyrin repeat protein
MPSASRRRWPASPARRAARSACAAGSRCSTSPTRRFLGGERTDGLLACAQALLGAGADPDTAWEHGGYERMSALHGAAGLAHEPRLTALLLAAGADPDDGRALRGAAGAEDPACLELLLDAGARVPGAMALAHAAQRGRVRTARMLLERGPREWGERDNALQWAVRPEASAEMVRLLVEHGADLEASFDGTGRTPYGVAVRSGRPDLAELLAELGARRRAEPLDELLGACLAGDGATARRVAAEDPAAAQLLRTAKADMLGRWAANGRREAVEILLDLGVPVDARGPTGLTALQEATRGDDPALVDLLLRRGADPRKRTPDEGEPPRSARGREATGRRPAADEPPYGELALAAQAAYLRLLGTSPLADRRPCGDGMAVITDVESTPRTAWLPAASTVTSTRRSPRRCAGCRDAPAQWLLADPVSPADLRARLVAAGARPERTGVVMGAVLDSLVLDDEPPPGVEVAPVRDEATAARVGAGGRARRAAGAHGRGPGQPRARGRRAPATPPRASQRRDRGRGELLHARRHRRRPAARRSSRPSGAPGSAARSCRRARARRWRRARASPSSSRRPTPSPSTGCWASPCARGPRDRTYYVPLGRG